MARMRTKPETRAAKWRRDDFDLGPTAVGLYRMWAGGDELLYIGISRSLVERWRTHRREAAWWHDVVEITVDVYRTRYLAECAETEAIRSERPYFNIAKVVV